MVPDKDDIVVREKSGSPAAAYLLGTFANPGLFLLQSHDEAVSQAVSFARQLQVRAWFNSDETFVLLGSGCDTGAEPAEDSPAR
jgi:hypothetical protein